jgi:hypothetical protein
MDPLQLHDYLSFLAFASSLLAILRKCVVTDPPSQQIELIREFRISVEHASQNCLRARSAALAREFETYHHDAIGRGAEVVRLVSKRLMGRHYVEESDRLIHALASLARDSGGMSVSDLRRRTKELKRVQMESVRLLRKLESA